MWESGSLTTETRTVNIQSVCNSSLQCRGQRQSIWRLATGAETVARVHVSPGTLRNCTTVIFSHTLNIVAA